MTILSTSGWEDYELFDSGNGKRLERFGKYVLSRPDPQCLWQPQLAENVWENAGAVFAEGGKNGQWLNKKSMPESWDMKYKNLIFQARLSPFKHTGVFPEQQVMWEWLQGRIKKEEKPKVLNLFGYTGIASLICAEAGAEVTHIDASYPTIGWARKNQELSNLQSAKIRWILDDCLEFVKREVRRGNKYNGIIMDPPVFGHGPNGERWEFNDNFPELLSECKKILSEKPLFVLINAYAVSASGIMLGNMLEDTMKGFGGTIESGELALEQKDSKRLLSTGIFGRWCK
ncbi:MAG TPA: class I SAM-dependent methyltransferase [Patescibacteria group bacterium]|nr:class I SAM-dependent methyltransferase [Patescibacteria group bacterium]